LVPAPFASTRSADFQTFSRVTLEAKGNQSRALPRAPNKDVQVARQNLFGLDESGAMECRLKSKAFEAVLADQLLVQPGKLDLLILGKLDAESTRHRTDGTKHFKTLAVSFASRRCDRSRERDNVVGLAAVGAEFRDHVGQIYIGNNHGMNPLGEGMVKG
jgi:hypothetical protein